VECQRAPSWERGRPVRPSGRRPWGPAATSNRLPEAAGCSLAEGQRFVPLAKGDKGEQPDQRSGIEPLAHMSGWISDKLVAHTCGTAWLRKESFQPNP